MDIAKYAIVQEWIKSEINKGIYKNGSKILSENELMEKFSFSRQTIRLAISNLENQGYLEKIKGSGTYVRLKNNYNAKETKNIGVIITYLDDYIFPDIINGIENILTNNNYNIILGITYNMIEKETIILNSMINKQVDGIIIEGCKTAMPNPNKDIYKQLKKSIPCIFINGYYNDLDMPYIVMNDIEGGYNATSYLINMGHKKIAGIFKSDDIQGHKRYEGYINALQKFNMPIKDHQTIWYTSQDKEIIFKEMYDKIIFEKIKDCTAVVCYNDQIASLFINFLKRINLKPFEDISIISFDNSQIAEILSLTSINHIKFNLGVQVSEALIKQIKTGEITKNKIKSELVVRNSVKDINIYN